MTMTAFVLIVFIKSGYAGGAFSQEFSSFDNCVKAQEVLEEKFAGTFTSVTSECIPK